MLCSSTLLYTPIYCTLALLLLFTIPPIPDRIVHAESIHEKIAFGIDGAARSSSELARKVEEVDRRPVHAVLVDLQQTGQQKSNANEAGGARTK